MAKFTVGQVLTAAELNGLIPSASGGNGANVPLPSNTIETVITTASLAVGVWLILVGVTVETASSDGDAEFTIVAGTATVTSFSGKVAAAVEWLGGPYSSELDCSLFCVATVTVAGTVRITGKNTSSNTANALSNTLTQGYGPATGYTAIQFA